jgi:hypothetical protein
MASRPARRQESDGISGSSRLQLWCAPTEVPTVGAGAPMPVIGIDHVQLAMPAGANDPFGNRLELMEKK